MIRFTQSWLAGLLLMGLCGCQPQVFEPVKAPQVQVLTLPEKNQHNIQRFPATVQAKDLIQLSFRLAGEINSLKIKLGQHVKKGEVIAKLDDSDLKTALQDKKAKLSLAKSQLKRSKVMVQQGNMSQSTLDQLEAKYRQALAEYKLAEYDLKHVALVAPFDGLVSALLKENHESVMPGTPVLEMYRIDKVEISVDLPDYVVARARKESEKMPITVSLDAYPDQQFTAYYLEHTAEYTRSNRTYQLLLEMPQDKKHPALQGMPGSIKVNMNKLHLQFNPFFLLPGEALVLPDDMPLASVKKRIWRLKPDHTVEPVAVDVAAVKDQLFEVSGPLQAGDKIVVKGHSYLRDGMAVRVVKNEGDSL